MRYTIIILCPCGETEAFQLEASAAVTIHHVAYRAVSGVMKERELKRKELKAIAVIEGWGVTYETMDWKA